MDDLHALTRAGVTPVPRARPGRGRHGVPVAGPAAAPPEPQGAAQRSAVQRSAVPVRPAPEPSPGGYGLDLGAEAGPWLVTHVRRRAANVALGCGASPDEALVIELLASELVTNAVVHGPERAHVAVRTAFRDGAFSVAVTDEGSGTPVLRDPQPTELSGRGLHVVANLASAWGVEPGATGTGTGGTTVWFTVDLACGEDRTAQRG
ncbi:ATP-binding protein [Cellulomonas cellasea]|nr:ATP-binding protein [Cellulomonas cellasea]